MNRQLTKPEFLAALAASNGRPDKTRREVALAACQSKAGQKIVDGNLSVDILSITPVGENAVAFLCSAKLAGKRVKVGGGDGIIVIGNPVTHVPTGNKVSTTYTRPNGTQHTVLEDEMEYNPEAAIMGDVLARIRKDAVESGFFPDDK